ncbi:DUF421 domain-containing protein [Taibaiella soli]|uniref:YetF C-terminal domain-containing protein n=1 Tax=Taibaiella soli TaxID=1649169 RepID=A0A2W2BC78_9BACT|nr:YetF domain-containing protein [Taibaiella soli]PZF71276.1 hypothetical protein DN068_18430 [Taibaiella soli]
MNRMHATRVHPYFIDRFNIQNTLAMHLLNDIFGTGKELTTLQMCSRGIIVFIVSWLLIRLSGRRSFGLGTPLDNIIVILLGTLLGRAVVGASPFIPIIAVSTLIVLLHRLAAMLMVRSEKFARLFEGRKIVLFQSGRFQKENMDKGLVCKEDVMQGVRKSALTNDLNDIDKVYMERNGEISPIKKQKD